MMLRKISAAVVAAVLFRLALIINASSDTLAMSLRPRLAGPAYG